MAAVGTVFQLAVESLSAAGASASLSPTSAPGAATDLGSRCGAIVHAKLAQQQSSLVLLQQHRPRPRSLPMHATHAGQ